MHFRSVERAMLLALSALVVSSTAGGYSASEKSNLEGVFALSFVVGLLLGGRAWFT